MVSMSVDEFYQKCERYDVTRLESKLSKPQESQDSASGETYATVKGLYNYRGNAPCNSFRGGTKLRYK